MEPAPPATEVGELWTARHSISPRPLLGHLMSLSYGTLQHLPLLKVSAKLLRSCSREVTVAAASPPSAFPPPYAPTILAAPL